MAKRKPKKPAKRLKQGVHWHGWAWRKNDGTLSQNAYVVRSSVIPTKYWVRVRFLPIADLPKLAERIAALLFEDDACLNRLHADRLQLMHGCSISSEVVWGSGGTDERPRFGAKGELP